MMEDLERIWSELERDRAQNEGYLRLRVRPSSHCGLFLAVEKPSNNRALLLEVPAAVIPPKTEYPQSSGFKVTPVPITHGPSGEVRLILAIDNNKYVDIFSVLVGDIIDHVAIQPDQPSGVKEFISRLIRWQEFLRRHTPEGLGDQAQQGLYGELWFLQNFIVPNMEAVDAARAWVGPLRANQDFQLHRCAVEVKTTSAEAHQVIHITNVRQLDDMGIECLLLFHISFDIRLGGVQSLPELVHEIRTLLENQDPEALYLFNERLIDAGYLDIHESRYQEPKYAVRNSHFFRVRKGFPRILESELPLGIGDVQYSIAVASCMPFKVDEVAAAGYILGEHNA
jgi:hypothetical protein